MELQHKHSGLNEQLGKVFKENADMITYLKEKEQLIRKLEADLSHVNHQYEEENREKLDALDRIKNLEQVVDKVIVQLIKKNELFFLKMIIFFQELGENKWFIGKTTKDRFRKIQIRNKGKRCKFFIYYQLLIHSDEDIDM
jgi:hypothetical protein